MSVLLNIQFIFYDTVSEYSLFYFSSTHDTSRVVNDTIPIEKKKRVV